MKDFTSGNFFEKHSLRSFSWKDEDARLYFSETKKHTTKNHSIVSALYYIVSKSFPFNVDNFKKQTKMFYKKLFQINFN